MMPDVVETWLDGDDRAKARELWDALMFPSTPCALEAARRRLIEAPAHIQQALINQIAGAIRDHRDPSPTDNPFIEPLN